MKPVFGQVLQKQPRRPKHRLIRRYEIERDEHGMPQQMLWLGDYCACGKPWKECKEEASKTNWVKELSE